MEAAKKRKFLIGLTVYAAILLLIVVVTNITPFNQLFMNLLRLLRPVLIGLILAYLLNTIFRFYERKLLYKVKPHGLRRVLSLTLTYLTLFLVIAALLLLIIPQLITTVIDFMENSETFAQTALYDLNLIIDRLNEILPAKSDGSDFLAPANPVHIKRTVEEFFHSLMIDGKLLEQLVNAETIGTVIAVAGNFVSLMTDILFGLFISIYLLTSKEKRYAQIMRLRRALFDDKVNAFITHVCETADRSFGGYLKGMILDSAMIGVLVYIVISIIGVPYAMLIATIIGITNVIPIIGPFIGVIPTAIIILLTKPSMVIPFVICVLVIQQIDGNIIAPRILGDNTGVSPLCVVIAICTMGTLWGLAGMILGVPLFATVLELTSEALDKQLKKKGLPTDTDIYYTPALTERHDGKTIFDRIRKKKVSIPVSSGGEGNLTPKERLHLDTYQLARKHELFSLKSEEILARFAEENAELAAKVEEPLVKDESLEPEECEDDTDTHLADDEAERLDTVPNRDPMQDDSCNAPTEAASESPEASSETDKELS